MYMEKAAETYEPIQNLLKAFRETNNCIIFIKINTELINMTLNLISVQNTASKALGVQM